MSRRFGGGGALRRKLGRLAPRKRILVVCEGGVTEPGYFQGWKNEARTNLLHIEVLPAKADPLGVVDLALEHKKKARAEAKQDPFARYDEVWCVFDRDEHAHYDEACRKAVANGLLVAASNPCFELWIMLHFEDCRKHIERGDAQSRCRHHIPGYVKTVPFDALRNNYEGARARAEALDQWQRSLNCAGRNPTTWVYLLTERVRGMGREEQLKMHSR